MNGVGVDVEVKMGDGSDRAGGWTGTGAGAEGLGESGMIDERGGRDKGRASRELRSWLRLNTDARQTAASDSSRSALWIE